MFGGDQINPWKVMYVKVTYNIPKSTCYSGLHIFLFYFAIDAFISIKYTVYIIYMNTDNLYGFEIRLSGRI